MIKPETCSRCGFPFGDAPETSRIDGSLICPDCAILESLADLGYDEEDAEEILDLIRRLPGKA